MFQNINFNIYWQSFIVCVRPISAFCCLFLTIISLELNQKYITINGYGAIFSVCYCYQSLMVLCICLVFKRLIQNCFPQDGGLLSVFWDFWHLFCLEASSEVDPSCSWGAGRRKTDHRQRLQQIREWVANNCNVEPQDKQIFSSALIFY